LQAGSPHRAARAANAWEPSACPTAVPPCVTPSSRTPSPGFFAGPSGTSSSPARRTASSTSNATAPRHTSRADTRTQASLYFRLIEVACVQQSPRLHRPGALRIAADDLLTRSAARLESIGLHAKFFNIPTAPVGQTYLTLFVRITIYETPCRLSLERTNSILQMFRDGAILILSRSPHPHVSLEALTRPEAYGPFRTDRVRVAIGIVVDVALADHVAIACHVALADH